MFWVLGKRFAHARSLALAAVCALLAACGGGSGTKKEAGPGTNSPSARSLSIVAEDAARSLEVGEGGSGFFRFKLSGPPPGDSITLTVSRRAGDQDVTFVPEQLTINAADWDKFARVAIAAARDDDATAGRAIIRVEGPEISPVEWIVTEVESYAAPTAANLVTSLSTVAMTEGGRATVGVSLSSAPASNVTVDASLVDAASDISLASGARLTFTASNWNQFQSVTVNAAVDADKCSSRGTLRLVASNGAQSDLAINVADRNAVASAPGTFSICGTISAPPFVAADTDVNDEMAVFTANDSVAQAQPLPNPAVVGGYVNAPGTGPAGRSRTVGDPSDFYSVRLTARQQLVLHIANAQAADLDLFLLDSSGTVVDASVGTGELEMLTVPADGNYVVEVNACATAGQCSSIGASNYVLTVGQSAGVAVAPNSLRLSDDFVSGDVIVKWSSQTASRSVASSAVLQNLSVKAGDQARAMLYQVNPPAQGTTARALVSSAVPRTFANDELAAKFETLSAIKGLRSQSDVSVAEPNYMLQPLAVPNDPLYNMQWHFPILNLPAAWDLTTGSSNVIVGVIDTGVLLNHPDMQGQTVAGYDFIRSATNALDGDGIDPNPDDPGDQGPNGSSFHGTHVSGTIAAATNNNQGVAGIAWGARVMPLRALGQFGGTDFDVIQCMLYAAGLANDSGTVPPRKVDVLNLSFGGPQPSQTMQNTIQQVRQAGVIVVAAAGNETTSALTYPASYPGVVAVSAVDFTKQLAPYSNFGSYVDVAAPGGDLSKDANADGAGDGVLSSGGSDRTGAIQFRYPVFQGTSMASPHVAGVVALMKSVFPAMTPQQFDDLLASGKITEDLGATGRDDRFGFGLIDAFKAVSEARILAQNGNTPPPVPPQAAAQPSTLNLGATLATMTFTVSNAGGGVLQVSAVTDNQPWLTVSPQQVDANGVGSYVAQVNRQGLAERSYNGQISVVTSAGTVTIGVVMEVRNVPLNANAGLQYVVLLEPDTHNVIGQVAVSAVQGQYAYSFDNVAPGVYHIFAGSDMNQDDLLCDPGEACGAFRTLEQPQMVIVSDSDVSSLDFGTGYQINFNAIGLSAGQVSQSVQPIPLQPR